ncbi:MAG TPA: dockerin type I domain-containing protein [Pirellulales bacterium]|nr:dockerin type I domain-containing protein [Pirellulales bacterium]
MTGTIWTGEVSADDVIPALDANFPQFQSFAVITDVQGEFVNANGTLATVGFNANGAPLGDYDLELTANKSSDSKFTDGLQNTVAASFTNGTLTVVEPGDFNRDLHVDASDVLSMMQALTNPATYESTHGNLTNAQLTVLGDVNNDGKFNNADLQALLNLLHSGGGSADPVPEPASWVLAFLALAMVAGSRLYARCVR